LPSNPTPVLAINALSAQIGRQGVLRDISLEISAGDWLAVVGGSGAGKSTLLRLIMGLRRPARPTSGEIVFDGDRWDCLSPKAPDRRGIALVPQSPAHGFDPLRRLRWQWQQLARRKSPLSAADQNAVLHALGLPALAESFPHHWSRGMQQRLLLAMALIERPRLLILDEPTSALDPLIAAQVLEEVRKTAQSQGIPVLMVTHDLALAAQFATKIAVMAQGALVESGPTERLLSDPQCAYTQDLVAHRHWQTTFHEVRRAAE
jgi:ABC-type glutathione transport system ATPase component